jgi:hypothetical protein
MHKTEIPLPLMAYAWAHSCSHPECVNKRTRNKRDTYLRVYRIGYLCPNASFYSSSAHIFICSITTTAQWDAVYLQCWRHSYVQWASPTLVVFTASPVSWSSDATAFQLQTMYRCFQVISYLHQQGSCSTLLMEVKVHSSKPWMSACWTAAKRTKDCITSYVKSIHKILEHVYAYLV